MLKLVNEAGLDAPRAAAKGHPCHRTNENPFDDRKCTWTIPLWTLGCGVKRHIAPDLQIRLWRQIFVRVVCRASQRFLAFEMVEALRPIATLPNSTKIVTSTVFQGLQGTNTACRYCTTY
jgi:hypothetical protein